ncbi:MAG: DegV family EDD domain-containing protein [Anaerolineae bacterium]|nr:DegV family EDD domain-containing protein [Anaerolineae bacterium]
MNSICILTDSTAQFPTPSFPGRNLVHVIPLHVQINGQIYARGEGIKATDMPRTIANGSSTLVVPPSQAEFETIFTSLSAHFGTVVTILHSADLSKTFHNAAQAASAVQGHIKIQLIDAQTTAVGLGMIVQAAAEAIADGMPAAESERYIRSLIRKVYSVLCIEGLTYLQQSGYLGPAQSTIGEYLKLLPIFIFESGHLVATQKARNYRHLVDILHEFVYEFPELKHIALLQGVPPFESETRALRERINEDFPTTNLSEHTISGALAGLIGPRSLGMFVMQDG